MAEREDMNDETPEILRRSTYRKCSILILPAFVFIRSERGIHGSLHSLALEICRSSIDHTDLAHVYLRF